MSARGVGVPARGSEPASALTASPTPPLDARALDSLAELDPGGASGLIERVLRTFLGSVDAMRADLEAGWRTGDLGAVKLVAHTFRSSAALVGALPFARLCGKIEDAIRLADLDDLPATVGQFGASLDAAVAAVRAKLEAGA